MFTVACLYVYKDVQRISAVKKVNMSRWGAPWQTGPYTNKHQHSTNTQNTKTSPKVRKKLILFELKKKICIEIYWNYSLKKLWGTAWVGSITNIRGLNQFFAIANLTLAQHLFEKKKKCLKYIKQSKYWLFVHVSLWRFIHTTTIREMTIFENVIVLTLLNYSS